MSGNLTFTSGKPLNDHKTMIN